MTNPNTAGLHLVEDKFSSQQRTAENRREGQQAGVGAGFDSLATLVEASNVKTAVQPAGIQFAEESAQAIPLIGNGSDESASCDSSAIQPAGMIIHDMHAMVESLFEQMIANLDEVKMEKTCQRNR